MKKRVYIAYTGGTIGMTKTCDGYAPAPGNLEQRIAAMPELASVILCISLSQRMMAGITPGSVKS